MKYTNNHNISLPIAAWLLFDEYDYIDKPNYISATTLLKPTKQLVLSKRIKGSDRTADVSDFIASSMGTAMHDSIEKAWLNHGPQLMRMLGYPEHICARIVVNPSDEYLKNNPDALAVWVEQRGFREIDGFTISGKFDIVIDEKLFDTKSTSVWAYILGGRDEEHSRQGSIYKWIFPEKIKDDFVRINYIFTDWQKRDAKSRPDYPQLKTLEKTVPLMSTAETEEFLRGKIREFVHYRDLPEEQIPECTDEDLWRTETKFKYFADPSKTSGRSTKNFSNLAEANAHKAKAGKGIVITYPGEVKRCAYCPAFDICKQKDRYLVQSGPEDD